MKFSQGDKCSHSPEPRSHQRGVLVHSRVGERVFGQRSAYYQGKQWATNKAHWRAVRWPCTRCGRTIDYNAPYWIKLPNGRQRINPVALVVGHVVSKAQARRLGWTKEQTNDLSNTQPECAACSLTSGATEGARSPVRGRGAHITRYL